MFNIDILCNYSKKDISKYDTDFLLSSVQYEEPKSIFECFLKCTATLIPVLLVLLGLIFIKINLLNFKFYNIFEMFCIASILSLFCCIIHKILSALSYPLNVVKKILHEPKLIFSFFNFNVHISKRRFLWICLFPNLILGFLPFTLWFIGVFDFNLYVSQMLIILSMINISYGTRDYYNAYLTLRSVPKDALIFNYGIHNYWYFPENKQ